MKPQISSPMNVYGNISLAFDEPIKTFDLSAIHLKQKVDTLWVDFPFEFEQDSIDIKKYNLYADWISKGEYEFSLDSLAFYGIYGLHTDKMKQTFKVKSEEEDYGEIFFNIAGADSIAYVELLSTQDNVLRKRRVVNGQVDFYFLDPGKYCARLVNDRNGNGVWDTGNFEKGEQPEEVYYYWQILELKVRQTFTQDWNVHSRPLDKQKPDELKKQKPDEDKKKQNAQNRNNQNRNTHNHRH